MQLRKILGKLGARRVVDIGWIGLDKILNLKNVVPQKYSFMTFGSHGVGFHAFLYYLSLCDRIFPLPIPVLCPNIIWFGKYAKYTSSRFFLYYLSNYALFHRAPPPIWGLTFDGILKNKEWIEKNCTLDVPAFQIVRDPIAIITSHLNWNLSNNILDFNEITVSLDAVEYILDNLEFSINFKSNLDKLKHKCTSLDVFDTTELVGNNAILTMKKVGERLGFVLPLDSKIDEFGKSINGPIQRRFPKEIIIDGVIFRISPFRDFFSLSTSVYKREYKEVFEVYKNKLFPTINFYVTTNQRIVSDVIREKLNKKLDELLNEKYSRIMIYEKYKLGMEDTLLLLSKNKRIDDIKKKIEFEISDLVHERYDLISKWRGMLDFLG